MNNILLVLAIFKFSFSACSDKTAETACTDETSCEWLPESCGVLAASECTSLNCHDNCPQTPEARGNCTDPFADCTTKTSSTDCASPGCNWDASGTCKAPVSPPTCKWDGSSCPSGCDDGSHLVCSKTDPYYCYLYSTALTLTECAYAASSIYSCTVSGSTCTGSGFFGAVCPTLSVSEIITNCTVLSDFNCKLSVSGSVRSCVVNPAGFSSRNPANQDDVDYCAQFSVSPLSECSVESGHCKISGTVCEDKTHEEVCNGYSITPMCESFSNGCCELSGSNCVVKTNAPTSCSYSASGCSLLDMFLGQTECELSDACKVDGNLCSYDTFPCEWDTAGTQCSASSISHGCSQRTLHECTNKNCISYNSGNCNSNPPCSWDSGTGHCSITSPLVCVPNPDGSCSTGSSSCDSDNYVPFQCNSPTVTAATCEALNSSDGCSGVVGCKWRATVGKCVDKEKTSEGSWMKKNWWVILVVVLAVVVVVAVIITVVVLKVKKKACFATAKVGVRDNSSTNSNNAPASGPAQAEAASAGTSTANTSSPASGEKADTALPAGTDTGN